MPTPKNFSHIPTSRPDTPLLDSIDYPEALRKIPRDDLQRVANELREFLLYLVGQTGGHFGAGLGVVELTVALHHVFNTPDDRLVWDVGHQAYPHKILTGRREKMASLRQKDGISPFPKRGESEYDTFGVGHSSTSISAALGMALGSKLKQEKRKHVAVIGDGAMTAGMAFEALNHASEAGADLLVVLNDNQMSISENVGGLSSYFSRIWASKLYNQIRREGQKVLSHVPPASEFVRRTEEHMKGMVSPGTLFEEMGFNYIGPIDGHDLDRLTETLSNLSVLNEPVLLHVITQKGRGFDAAELDPIAYHALGKGHANQSNNTDISATELPAATKLEPIKNTASSSLKRPKYQDVFGQWLCDMAQTDSTLIGITPAMREGSGMVEFSNRFPAQYQDVGIAEQHAVTLAAGIACEGLKPVVAIYSTFLQRAYDQLIHDVAIQNLDVLFAIDRAGIVGEDGATHAGSMDLSFLRCVPNMLIMAPSDENETRHMLYTGYHYRGPAAVRYPRGTGTGIPIDDSMKMLPIGRGRIIRKANNSATIAILNFGVLLPQAEQVAEQLDATLVDMRFVKPIDESLLTELSQQHDLLVTVEENVISGGAGSAVNEYLSGQAISTRCLNLGLPDYYQEHGTREQLLQEAGLDSAGILASIETHLSMSSSG